MQYALALWSPYIFHPTVYNFNIKTAKLNFMSDGNVIIRMPDWTYDEPKTNFLTFLVT
jgi:hypothetical protein